MPSVVRELVSELYLSWGALFLPIKRNFFLLVLYIILPGEFQKCNASITPQLAMYAFAALILGDRFRPGSWLSPEVSHEARYIQNIWGWLNDWSSGDSGPRAYSSVQGSAVILSFVFYIVSMHTLISSVSLAPIQGLFSLKLVKLHSIQYCWVVSCLQQNAL